MNPQFAEQVIFGGSINATQRITTIIEIEFLYHGVNNIWRYEWASQLLLLRMSLYSGVNNDVTTDHRGNDYWDLVCTGV